MNSNRYGKNTNNCCTVQLEDTDGGQGVAQ